MSYLDLGLTLVFVASAMLLSAWHNMGLGRDIAVGAVRAAVQLIAVGYVLQFIFDMNSIPYLGLMIGIMIVVAADNARRKAKRLSGVFVRVCVALVVTEVITMGIMLVLGIIEFSPRYVIPISGMIIGNAMVSASLLLNRFKAEVQNRRLEIETSLTLGADARTAVRGMLRSSVKASTLPHIDALKTVGLVQLPGMMTGQIIGGASPVEAVRYQILVMYSLASSTAICSILLGFLLYPLFFTPYHQLRTELLDSDEENSARTTVFS